jgi:hypothetical protein
LVAVIDSKDYSDVSAAVSGMGIASASLLNNRALLTRRDWKFIMPVSEVADYIEGLRDTHAVLLAEGKSLARYRTQYFDTPDLLYFHDHRRGRRRRQKVRVRHYLDREISMLEVKSRVRSGRTVKQRLTRPWQSEEIDASGSDFIGGHTANYEHQPTVRSIFRRLSLLGLETQERLTIDLGIRLELNEAFFKFHNVAILEVKGRDIQSASAALSRAKHIGLRQGSFSKYCVGMSLLDKDLRSNVFRPILRTLNRMEES